MSVSYYNLRAREMMWDIPRIITGEQNLQSGYAASFKQSPTAALPACWQLIWTGGLAVIFHLSFSTDTAIQWGLYPFAGNAGLTTRSQKGLGGFGPVQNATFSADVVAAPANTGFILQGFAAANSYTDCLQKSWVIANGTNLSLVFATSAVAANCILNIHWTELTT